MFLVMTGDFPKDWPSDMSLLLPSASGYRLHALGAMKPFRYGTISRG